MKKNKITLALLFSASAAIASLLTAIHYHGSPFSTVTSAELLKSGAIDGQTLQLGEYWRLVSAQFLHSKQFHMIFNVMLCWFIGSFIESALSSIGFALIYAISGLVGTFSSVLWYPEYVSSGLSQAMMGLFAAVFILKLRKIEIPKPVMILTLSGTIAQLGLDLYVNHGPKIGHVTGFIVGTFLSIGFVQRLQQKSSGLLKSSV